jgi:hypothetical protein
MIQHPFVSSRLISQQRTDARLAYPHFVVPSLSPSSPLTVNLHVVASLRLTSCTLYLDALVPHHHKSRPLRTPSS